MKLISKALVGTSLYGSVAYSSPPDEVPLSDLRWRSHWQSITALQQVPNYSLLLL